MFALKLTLLLIIALTEVEVVEGEEVIGIPINTVAVRGTTARMACRYHLKSCIGIRWTKRQLSVTVANISDGNKVTAYDRRYKLDNSSACELVLESVQLSDSGTFVCTIDETRSWFADLIVLNAEPLCSSTCQNDSTVEGGQVDFKCALTYSGGGSPTMSWFNMVTRVEIAPTPAEVKGQTSVSRDFSWITAAPGFPPLVCLTRFYFDQTAGRANNVPEVRCETASCNILYSVRNVVTWPAWKASPGETITCKADGNPEPEFEWQSNDGDGKWEDVEYATSETIVAFLNNETTSTNLRCVAKNKVNGKDFSMHSDEVNVSKYGGIIRIAVIIGVIVGIVILVVIAGVVYKFCFSG